MSSSIKAALSLLLEQFESEKAKERLEASESLERLLSDSRFLSKANAEVWASLSAALCRGIYMEKAALKARLAKGGKAPAGGKYQMNLSTMARLLEALVLKAMPNQGLASSFLDPLCSHFIDILPDSDALFKPLAGIYGRLLRTLLNSREYRSLLTPSYTLNLLHLCRFALIGHDDAEQPDRGGNSGSKENDESRYNLKKVSSSSLSSAEMVDFARCFQCLVLSLPRDLSSQNGQQASYLFASISLFFKQYPQESGAHPILLSTANHVLWEYALNDIPASYKFCSALAPRILKYWDSKRLMKGFLIPFLRIYLGLMDAQKIIHSIELKSSDLLLIWDALSKDLTSRFSPPPVMSHVDALEFLKHHNPDDTRLDPLESGASISSTSLESYGFSEFLALAGSLILDFQATDLEVHSKTCYGCHHRIHHISVFSFLSKCALQDGSSTEKSLASQVLFCLASSHSHRLDEGQLQELCLALKGGSLELSCNDNIWLTMGLANLVSTVVKESSALFETQYHGIVSDNIERTTSDAFLYLSTVIIKQSTVMLKKTLSLRPVVNWTQALSLSDHSIRFLELLLSISSPSASDVQSCLSWVFKELKSGKTSSPVSLVSFLCSLAGVRFEIQGRLNQNTDRLRPRYSPDVDETLLSEWRQSRFTTILAFMLEGPKVFLEPSLKLVKSKSNQKQTAKHCIETIVKCINALPEDPQADRSGFALLTFSLIDLLQLWKCHGILAARLLTSTEVVAALKKLLSLCQGMDFISTEISRELHALRTLGDIRVHTLWPLEMQCVQSWVTKFATRTFVSLEAGPTAPVKRKRQRENLSDSDDDFVMTSSVSNGSSSKMTSGVSITASYFGFAAPCQYQDWKGQWGPALGNLSQIVAQRQFLGASVMSVSDAEWCWIEKILESDFLFLEDSLVIFYDELISWVEASVERLSEEKIVSLVSILLGHIQIPAYTQDPWMMIASLRILGAVIPFAILFKNKELQQTIHHLVQAFISLLRGKKDMTSSHDFRMSWRITVSFCAFLVSYTLADPGLQYLRFDKDQKLLMTFDLLSFSWVHHEIGARIYMTTNVLRSLDRTSSETLSQTAIQHILDAPQMTDNSVSFFVTTAYSLKSLAICYPSCRIMTVLTLLKLLKSDYDLFYVSECLQELANALNFGSREDLLNELLHQKLLERWGREIKQIPFVLFGHTNFDEFCAKNAHIIVPMYIAQERYDHVQEIASLTGVTVPVLIQKFFPFIVTAILSTLSEGKRMDTDSRLSFLAKSLGVSDLSQHLRTSGASILFKMLQFMDDDTGIESKSSAYSVSLRKMREFVPERQNRPKLHQAIKVKNLTEFMKFIDGASLSLVQLHNLLQSLQEYIETQVLEYERTRLLTNAFRIFVVLFVDKLEHPLLFHMAVTTLWKYVLDESRTYISCSLIIYIFSEISSRNPEVFKSHCIDAFEVMAPFLHSSSRHLALHCLRVLLRLLQQVWPEMVTPVVKKLRAIDSSFSLPSHSDIVVKDKILIEHLFDPLNPEHFKGFLVGPLLDSLCSPETISTLQRDSVLPSALIKRLLMLVKESTDEIILSDLALALGKIQSLVGSQSLDFEREPANMGESVAFQGLLKTLLDSSPTIAGLAARALSRILSIPEYLEVAKALDHSTFQMIDLFAGRYRKKMPPSKNGGEYSSILDLDHWSFDGSSSTAWTADLVCRILPYQPISRYHYLTAVIEQVPDIATQIFPFVVFNGLTDIDFKKYFESHLGSVFSSPGTCDPSLLNLFIRTVDYIRSQRHPDATNLFDNNQLWLSLNFEDVSRACISVKSYEHALLFAEIDLSLTHRSLAQAKNHSTLLDIFRNLEESDGFNGIMMLMDAQDFTESSVKQKLAYEKSWDYLTQMQEAELYIESPEPNQSVSGLSLALKNSGHYAVAQRFIEASLHHEPSILDSISLTDIYSDCCWRTGLSTVGSLYNDSQSSSALLSRCFSSENRSLAQIRDIIPESLVTLLQDWKERAGTGLSVERLLPLVELHEIMSTGETPEAHKRIKEIWDIRTDSLAKTCDPSSLGTLLASRTRSLLSASLHLDLGREPLSHHLKEHLLYYSKYCRKQNDTQTSLQALGLYRSHVNDGTQLVPPLLGFADVSSALERLKLLCLQGQKALATKCLKGLLLNSGAIFSDLERATLYGTLGHWIADTRTESAINIMNNYLNQSLKLTKVYGKSHNRLAKYADTHYSELLKDHELIAPVQLELKRHKQDEVSQYDEILALKISEEHKTKIQHSKHRLLHEIEMDQREYDRRAREIQEFLLVSVENYLLSLRSSSNKWDMSVFRIVSLWFANTGTAAGVNQRIARHVPKIPSRKFLVLMYQLSARILSVDSEEKEFFNILCGLIEKMAKDHPFHCLYQVIALHNTEALKKSTVSSAATSLLKKLRSQMPNIVQHLEFLSDGYIKLAGDPIPKATKSREKTFGIRPDNPLLRVRNLASIPPITADIPIDDTCQYKNVAGIERFENSYWIPGGINAPKVITCRSSNGQSYRQLVKGNDDLRQDAVLSKVFEIVNVLLSKEIATRKRNLTMRTYRVVPLSPKAGVVHWVSNTVPLANCLLDVHKRYHPNEWKQETCREKMMKEHARRGCDTASKVLVYDSVQENFTPAFRYLFFEQFTDPDIWFKKRLKYTRSAATSSITGFIMGLGDRHVNNILLDQESAELIHIDLGIAFDQGKLLSTPETVPFRLTRDVVDAMGITGVEGTFRTACEETLRVLRREEYIILTILDVFRFDPLYRWSSSVLQKRKRQDETSDCETVAKPSAFTTGNKEAARALLGVQKKLLSNVSVECQVNDLIQTAMDSKNLARMFPGWQAWM